MSTHEELLAMVRANPRDEQAWGVLQDWLLSQGDPRGRLATASQKEVPALLEELAPQWFGRPVRVKGDEVVMREKLEDDWSPGVQLQFWRGHVRQLQVAAHWDGSRSDWGQGWICPLLERIVSQPVGQLIVRMELRATPNSEFSYGGLVESLTRHAPLAVRTLYAGDNDQLSWTNVPDCRSLWAAAPFLDEVKLEGSDIRLGELVHERLRKLHLVSGGLPREPIEALVRARVPQLADLDVWFGDSEYGAECSVDDVVPLLERDFPMLQRIGLRNCEFSDALVPRVLKARWLRQLKELRLGGSILTDQAGEALLAGKDALLHLEKLELNRCFLSEAMVGRLQAALGDRVSVANQQKADQYGDETYYYVEVGE